MSGEEGPSEEALIAALERTDRRAARAEMRWYRFTSAYAVILAGSLALVRRGDIVVQGLLAGFIFFLTLPGIITTLKASVAYHYYGSHCRRIADELELEEWLAEPLYRHRERRLRTPFGMSRVPWFVLIYLVPLAAIPAWFAFLVTASPILTAVAFAIIFFPATYVAWRYSTGMLDAIEETADVDQRFRIRKGT